MEEINIKRVNAQEFIKSERLDLIVKEKYVENREKSYGLKFIEDLYREHIEAYSDGTFTELDNPQKNSIDKYMEAFDKVIDSVRTNGVDEKISVVPINSNNVLLNGAHRTSAAIYFDKDIPVVLAGRSVTIFDTAFMKKQHMKTESIDYIVNEYVKMKKNGIHIAIMWPKINWRNKREEVLKTFEEYGKIIYSKDISLNYNGIRNTVLQAYHNHDWVGSYKDHYKGINADLYYGKNKTTVVVYEADSLDEVLKAKKKIRDILGIGNYGIHITDTYKEAVELANMFFNANTVDFINRTRPDRYVKTNANIHMFIEQIEKNNLNIDDFVIASSTVIGLYGLRDSGDVDYFSLSDEQHKVDNEIIECQDKYLDYYGTSKADLIYNPANYFRYLNVKFVMPQYVKNFKKKRNGEKDKVDVKLLNQIIQNKKVSLKTISFKFEMQVFRTKRTLWNNARKVSKVVLPKSLYMFLKRKYHKIKSK